MQSELDILIHPLDLSVFGLTPQGKPVYRVVWADSRKSRVFHLGKRYDLPRYPGAECKGKWVLEKWHTASEVVGISRDAFDALIDAMPGSAVEQYPVDGDYELADLVFTGEVREDFVRVVLRAHEHIRNSQTPEEMRLEQERIDADKEKLRVEVFDAIYEEGREESLLCRVH